MSYRVHTSQHTQAVYIKTGKAQLQSAQKYRLMIHFHRIWVERLTWTLVWAGPFQTSTSTRSKWTRIACRRKWPVQLSTFLHRSKSSYRRLKRRLLRCIRHTHSWDSCLWSIRQGSLSIRKVIKWLELHCARIKVASSRSTRTYSLRAPRRFRSSLLLKPMRRQKQPFWHRQSKPWLARLIWKYCTTRLSDLRI